MTFYRDLAIMYFSEENLYGKLFMSGGGKIPNLMQKRNEAWVRIHSNLSRNHSIVSLKSVKNRWRSFVQATIQKRVECDEPGGPQRSFSEVCFIYLKVIVLLILLLFRLSSWCLDTHLVMQFMERVFLILEFQMSNLQVHLIHKESEKGKHHSVLHLL